MHPDSLKTCEAANQIESFDSIELFAFFLHQPACGRLKPGLVQIWLRLEESLFALSADSMRAFDIDFAESLTSVDCSEEVQKSQMTSAGVDDENQLFLALIRGSRSGLWRTGVVKCDSYI